MNRSSKLDLLISIYIFCVLTSEMMGGKTFALYHGHGWNLTASVAIFVIPVVFLITDMITEVYGRQRARAVVRYGFLTIVLLALYSALAVSLPPSARFASSEPAYTHIFGTAIRISIASLLAFAGSELLDVAIFSAIRSRLGGKALWLRTNVANILGQLADGAIFMVLAFWDPSHSFASNASFLWSLILPYWVLRSILAGIETPFVYLGVRWLKSGREEA